MFCSQCGTQNDGDARFCQNCGAALSIVPLQDHSVTKLAPGDGSKKIVLLIISILCVGVLIGGAFTFYSRFMSKELSRGKAADLIRASTGGDGLLKITHTLQEGEFEDYGFNVSFGSGAQSEIYKRLQEQGYGTLEKIGYADYRVTLSPKIQPYVVSRGKSQRAPKASLGPKAAQYFTPVEVLLFTKRFDKVTGLTKGNVLEEGPECEVKAEFKINIELSPLASVVSGKTPESTKSGLACFKLYDNGWRMTGINW